MLLLRRELVQLLLGGLIMPMQNPVVGGSQLVRVAIKSANYVAGSAGWAIFEDGSAEFNDVVIRGSTTEDGIFLLYNGTPAAGNLIFSIAAVAGADAFGNTYPAGLKIVGAPGTGAISISPYPVVAGESPVLQFASGQGIAARFGQIRETTTVGNTAGVLVMTGPALPAAFGTDYMELDWYSRTTGGIPALAQFSYYDTGGTPYPVLLMGSNGASMTGLVQAQQPGASVPTVEQWHQAVLTGGWTGSGNGVNGLWYRMLPFNTLHIVADLHVPASPGNIFTFPVGWRPNAQQNFPAGTYVSGVTPHCQITPAGVLQGIALGGTGTALVINSLVPLDTL